MINMLRNICKYYKPGLSSTCSTLQGSDAANSFSVYGREVDIIASKPSSGVIAQSTTGSNKVGYSFYYHFF